MDPAAYTFDPLDPRAPTQEVWDALSPVERQRIVDALPSEFPLTAPPEGDLHRQSKEQTLQTLEEHFRRTRRPIYLSSELPVYYPGEPMFAPDVLAVCDVPPHQRRSWVVSHEGKGLDFVLEIHAFGRYSKDFRANVERFARLKIPEYFAFDPYREHLAAWRLGADGGYVPIIPQGGRWASNVLGLDLALGERRLVFFHGAAELLDARHLIDRLSVMVDDAVRRAEDEARRAEDEARRAEDEARRAEDEARRAEDEARRADRLAARLRALGADPDDDAGDH